MALQGPISSLIRPASEPVLRPASLSATLLACSFLKEGVTALPDACKLGLTPFERDHRRTSPRIRPQWYSPHDLRAPRTAMLFPRDRERAGYTSRSRSRVLAY